MSAISWLNGCPGRTGEVWNPYVGCLPQGKGCDPCCALENLPRLIGNPIPAFDPHREVTRKNASGKLCWNGKVALIEKALTRPLSWKKPRLIFGEFYGDPFFNGVPYEDQCRVAGIMEQTPQHEYLMLTKHPREAVVFWANYLEITDPIPANVWAGVSVYDQASADEMFPHMKKLADSGFKIMVSLEPLLSHVVLPEWLLELDDKAWVVIGGQSAKKRANATRMECEWVYAILEQLDGSNIAVHFKQWGEYNEQGELVGKKAAGHLVLGHVYRDFPGSMGVLS